jgi:hypothetical protein
MYKPHMASQCKGCRFLYNGEYCLLKDEYIEDLVYVQCIEKVSEEEDA